MLAASSGDFVAVEECLAAAAQGDAAATAAVVNAQDNFGYTALMYAASAGHAQIVEALIAAGGDLHKKNRQGLASLDLAVAKGHASVVQTLRHARLFFAARDGDHYELTTLLEQGADVNAQVTDGWTALMIAAFHDHPFIIQTLLARGANSELETITGRTALMIARQRGHEEVVSLLYYYGAEPEPLSSMTVDATSIIPPTAATAAAAESAPLLELDISTELDK